MFASKRPGALLFLPVPGIAAALRHVAEPVLDAGADVRDAVAEWLRDAAGYAVDGLAEAAGEAT